jgi:transcriptional regulator with XRE-family HTH domain
LNVFAPSKFFPFPPHFFLEFELPILNSQNQHRYNLLKVKVSQQKNLANFEKGKLLISARKRLGLSQVEMAQKLNLDSTYLSQLENGRREVDEFYVNRAEELAREFENANKLKASAEAIFETTGQPTRESCLRYLQRFLETCTDAAKLGWTAIELKEHFPLDKWALLNSVPDAVAAQAATRAVAAVQKPGVVYGRSRRAASTSGKTSSRASRAGAASNAPPAPPKPAPK